MTSYEEYLEQQRKINRANALRQQNWHEDVTIKEDTELSGTKRLVGDVTLKVEVGSTLTIK